MAISQLPIELPKYTTSSTSKPLQHASRSIRLSCGPIQSLILPRDSILGSPYAALPHWQASIGCNVAYMYPAFQAVMAACKVDQYEKKGGPIRDNFGEVNCSYCTMSGFDFID
jgi:hypothetical protein